MNIRTRGVQADGKINLTADKASGKFCEKLIIDIKSQPSPMTSK
jgi:hypothetical protein